jgi:hypothetical protein
MRADDHPKNFTGFYAPTAFPRSTTFYYQTKTYCRAAQLLFLGFCYSLPIANVVGVAGAAGVAAVVAVDVTVATNDARIIDFLNLFFTSRVLRVHLFIYQRGVYHEPKYTMMQDYHY